MKQQQRVYTKEDYNRIHELVYKYKDGSKEAGLELLESFSGFLNKYVSLLHFGKFDLKSSSIRNFIKLFIDNQVKRSSITSYKHNKGAGHCAAQETVEKIIAFFSCLSKEDIEQEISNIFLIMASKYKDTKPSFQNHIEKNFHYYAFRHFEKLTRDPLSRGDCIKDEKRVSLSNSDKNICASFKTSIIEQIKDVQFERYFEDLELKICVDQSISSSDIPIITNLDCTKKSKDKAVYDEDEVKSIYNNDFLDSNWINGITCGDVFKVLTPFERRILLMWYIEKKTDAQIAEAFGLCRGTVNNRKAKAKEKLKKEIERLNLIF